MFSRLFFVFVSILIYPKIISIMASNCEDYVSDLSQHDVFLSYRKDLANALVKNSSTTVQSFIDSLDKISTGGEKYACGLTRFWIDEIFLGDAKLYEALRRSLDGYGTNAGFHDVIGENQISNLFEKYSDLKDNYVLFGFQTFGVADHVWAVLQVPGPKYKIFQSYNMAYSVHAWTSASIEGLYSKNPPGHIRYWDDVFDQLKKFITEAGGSISDDGTITFPPGFPESFEPWANYIVNYNQTKIEENFKKAWDRFGQGKWIEKSTFMNDYVKVLQRIMDTMKPMVGTPTLWPEETHQDWISLFASPNPVVFPGIPFNFLTGNLPDQTLELQVRVEVIKQASNDCYNNYKLIGKTVPGWTDGFTGGAKIETGALKLILLMIFILFISNIQN